MAATFKGIINVDIRDSVPGLGAVRAAEGARGRAERRLHRPRRRRLLGAGLLRRADRDAEHRPDRRATGVRYTQWHTTALCSPTRSCLLTGRNHTRNSMACITEAAIGFPNASGTIPPENGHAPEILGERGWNTYMVGKWHLCPDDEMNLASTRRNWPTRPRLRALLRLPRRRDQPVVSRPRLRQPPRRPAAHARGGLPPDRWTSPTRRSSSSRTPRRSRRTSRSSSTTRPGPATRRTTRRRSGSTSTRAASTWATRRCASRRSRARRSSGIVPEDTELPPINPIGTPETRTGPDGKPFPALDVTRPWDSLVGGRAAAVLPHGRGLRRLPRARRRPDRPAARLPRGDRAAREHDDRRRLRQRRQRRGRPERLGQREQVLQRHPGRRSRQNLRDARRARRPEDLQPLPQRLGDGVQHAVQDVEALRVQRRHAATRASSPGRRASRPRGEIRDQYHHAIDIVPTILDCLGVEPPETIKGHVQSRFDGVSMRYSFDDAAMPDARARRSSTRCSARAAIWHEGWKAVTDPPARSAAGATSTTTRGSSTTPTSTAPSCTTSPAEHPEKLRELVNLWFAEAGANGAFPLDDRSALEIMHHAAPAADAARATATSTTPDVAEVPESQAVNVRNRSYAIGARRRHPRRRAPRACCSPTARGSAATPSTSRTTGCTTSTTSSACFEQKIVADRGRADRREPDPVGRVRRRTARTRPASPTGTLSLYHGEQKVGEGRIKTQPGKFMHRRRGALRRPRQRRPGHRRLPGRAALARSPAARSTASPSTSAASPTSTSSARPKRC